MALVYYRGGEFVQDYLVKYLNSIFLANKKGVLTFTDGLHDIKFSALPYVIKRGSWDFRNLPAVLVGEVSSVFSQFLTNSYIKEPMLTDTAQVETWGGDINITMGLSVRAISKEEVHKIADITGIFLSNPLVKEYFSRQGFRIPNPPTTSEARELYEPNIDHPIYEIPMKWEVVGVWREEIASGERLIDIIVDITAELDL